MHIFRAFIKAIVYLVLPACYFLFVVTLMEDTFEDAIPNILWVRIFSVFAYYLVLFVVVPWIFFRWRVKRSYHNRGASTKASQGAAGAPSSPSTHSTALIFSYIVFAVLIGFIFARMAIKAPTYAGPWGGEYYFVVFFIIWLLAGLFSFAGLLVAPMYVTFNRFAAGIVANVFILGLLYALLLLTRISQVFE